MTKNVIEFPKSKIVRDAVVSVEEVEKAKEKGKMNYADSIVSEISLSLYEELENYGIDVDSEDTGTGTTKDFVFLTDVLKSVIYRNMGLEHSLHEFIDDNVAVFTNEKDYKEFLEKEETTETQES